MTAAFPLKWPEGWPRASADARNSSYRFQVTFDKAVTELYESLAKLGAQSIVVTSHLQLNARGQILGGNSRQKLPEPGVAVYFFRDGKEYVLAQDAFDAPLGNLRSIGLALEGLRQLERHGGAHLAERAFGGFAALPPPEKPFSWREELGLPIFSNMDIEVQLALAEAAYRLLAKKAHPDSGGNAERMARLNKAIAAAREELK